MESAASSARLMHNLSLQRTCSKRRFAPLATGPLNSNVRSQK